jgi:uncharacterized membrane protein YkoI
MKISIKHVMVLLGLILTAAAVNVYAYTGEKLAGEARITMKEARSIALKVHPGKIIEESLEREKGSLRFSFDIREGKVTHEVNVDANTGKVQEQ